MRPLLFALLAGLALAGCSKGEAPAHLEKARSALFQNKPDVALGEYKQALDSLERDDSAQAQVYRARALRGAADTYYLQLRDTKRAVEVYRELIHLCPEAPETLEGRLHLADLLQHEFRDLRGAIAELTAALARNPPQSAALAYRVATLYFELQDYSQCELEAARVAEKYETSAWVDDALLLRAQALSMMDGRSDEAVRAFNEVLTRFPDSEVRPHVLFELGRLKAAAGDGEGAIELWVKALERHPQPEAVQAAISKARQRLRATTPDEVGNAATAFDHTIGHRRAEAAAEVKPPPKTSIEAVGGTAEEAEREARMQPEGAHPEGAAPKELPAQGEGSL